MVKSNLEKEIWAYALKNALEFKKADAGKILSKLFQHGLAKENIKDIMPQIQEIVKKVNYLKEDQFNAHNIEVKYQDFSHPVYPQLYGEFVSALAAIDLLFNCGPNSLSILRKN